MRGPLRFTVKGDEVIEKGGQVLARFNTECIPSILDEFVLFLTNVSQAGTSEEIEDTVYPDKDEVSEKSLTKYNELRDELNGYVIGGLVPVPVALLFLRKALETTGDEEDIPVIEEPNIEIDWTNDGDETERQTPDQILYSSEQLGELSSDGGNFAGVAEG